MPFSLAGNTSLLIVTMTEPENYRMTEKGWKIAADVWGRFVDDQEDIDQIAASYSMSRDELAVLMAMAFQGGIIADGD